MDFLQVCSLIWFHRELLHAKFWLALRQCFLQAFCDEIVFAARENGRICFSRLPGGNVNALGHSLLICRSFHVVTTHLSSGILSGIQPSVPREQLGRAIFQKSMGRELLHDLVAPMQHETIFVQEFGRHVAQLRLLLLATDAFQLFGFPLGNRLSHRNPPALG